MAQLGYQPWQSDSKVHHYVMLLLSSNKSISNRKGKVLEYPRHLIYASALTGVVITFRDHKSRHSGPSPGLSRVCVLTSTTTASPSPMPWSTPYRGRSLAVAQAQAMPAQGRRGWGEMRAPKTQSTSRQDLAGSCDSCRYNEVLYY